jgi:hypothetical protein
VLLSTVCRIEGGEALIGVPGIETDVYNVEASNGQIWIGARDGIYRMQEDGTAQNVLRQTGCQMILGDTTLWVIGKTLVYRATQEGQLRPIADVPKDFDAAEAFENSLWLKHPSSATTGAKQSGAEVYVIRPGGERAELQLKGVKAFEKGLGRLWFVTGEDYSDSLEVNGEERAQGVGKDEVYVAENDGAFRQILAGKTVGRVSIAENGGNVWIWDDKNLFRSDQKAEPQPFLENMPARVRAVSSVGKRAFIDTDAGVFETGSNRSATDPVLNKRVFAAFEAGGISWLFTSSGVYGIDEDHIKNGNGVASLIISPARDDVGTCLETRLCGVAAVPHGFFIRFGSQLFFVNRDTHKSAFVRSDLLATQMFTTGNSVWVSTKDGIYSVNESGTPKHEISEPELLNVMTVGNRTWLATNMGVHEALATGSVKLVTQRVLHFLKRLNGTIWVGTSSGLLRLRQDGELVVAPLWATQGRPKQHYKLQILFTQDFTAKAYYYWKEQSKDSNTADPEWKYVVDTDEKLFGERIKSPNRYDNNSKLQVPLPLGFTTVHISAEDKWNNRASSEVDVLVLPPTVLGPIFVAFAWALFISTMILAAPYWDLANDLTMNPWVRKLGSMYLVPVLITTIPKLRQHFLIRYRRKLAREEDLQQLKKGYVLPVEELDPSIVSEKIYASRAVFLQGRSGVGKTAYCRILLEAVASGRPNALSKKGVVPVYISLARVQDGNVLDGINTELAKYGRLTDEELVGSMVQQGGFLFILDGWNEVKIADRKAVWEFVEQNRNSNYFCVCSQLRVEGFDQFDHIALGELSPEKVDDLIVRQLSKELVTKMLQQFDEAKYALFSLPQDLKLGIAIVKQNGVLPNTRDELYARSLAPIFDDWQRSGRDFLQDLLKKRAYEMIKTSEATIDLDGGFPGDIVNALKEQGLVTLFDDRYRFQHELIRAFLASGYFGEHWKNLIADEKLVIDGSWRAMLEFTCLKINNDRSLEALLFALLERGSRMAGLLFSWLVRNYTARTESWAEAFKLKYGEITMPS